MFTQKEIQIKDLIVLWNQPYCAEHWNNSFLKHGHNITQFTMGEEIQLTIGDMQLVTS